MVLTEAFKKCNTCKINFLNETENIDNLRTTYLSHAKF